MTRITRASIEALRYAFAPGSGRAARAALGDAFEPGRGQTPARHLEETIGWLFRAHDATNRHGVSRSFTLRRHHRYGCTGWLPAYPETSGYIVPTLFEAAEVLERPEAHERAIEIARWEADIQMDDGAVRGGTVADEPSPAVFNTGQVLFGWLAAARRTGDLALQNAAERAAAWLVEKQDDDGVWRRGASAFAAEGAHVYNARAAWALALYGTIAGDEAACRAARRSADYALGVQIENGWYGENCLTDDDQPLVHTIAYTAQGVLEIGVVLGVDAYVDSARRCAKSIAATQRADGYLHGRYDRNWNGTVDWSCLTGDAQMALVWDRLSELDGDAQWREHADRACDYVCSTQELDSNDEGIRGAVGGSFPIWGGYGTYENLNWAAKFHCDTLLGRVTGRPCGTQG
ncbi:MAG: hypothetical protein KDB80_01880 [Planctomycetes bacterium]|nr:hypothetical protein [Planctomycetota bacterium]